MEQANLSAKDKEVKISIIKACYMTDGSGVYHMKYNEKMPTVWAI